MSVSILDDDHDALHPLPCFSESCLFQPFRKPMSAHGKFARKHVLH